MTREERERVMQQAEAAIEGSIKRFFGPLPDWVRGKTILSILSGYLVNLHDEGETAEAAKLVLDLLKIVGEKRPALLALVFKELMAILPDPEAKS